MGSIFNIRWIHNGIVATGPYCTTQGIVQQFGEVGVGLSILVRLILLMSLGPRPTTDTHLFQLLAVHTFVSALWRVGLKARRFSVVMIFLVFCYVTLWVSIGPRIHKHYEIPTPVR